MEAARIALYCILGIPLIVLLMKVTIVGFSKKQMPSGLLATSIAVLAIVLFIFCLFDTGHVDRFVMKIGDKDYYISSNALEEVILKNIDNFGMALARVYEEYYIIETFDYSKESERVKYAERDGKKFLGSKLKYQPVVNSIQWSFSGGWYYSPSLENKFTEIDEELFIWEEITYTGDIEQYKKALKEDNVVGEIRYLRKR